MRGRWRGEDCLSALRRGGEAALPAALEALLAASNRRLPVDSGALLRSGRVEARGLEGRVVYGAPHAAAQHENTRYRHPRGGQAGFLREAARDPAVQREALPRLAESLRRALG